MAKLENMTDEELIGRQQELMAKRGESERGFKEQQQAVQFELDKRAAKARFGNLTDADRAAIAELESEAAERAAAEPEVKES